MNKLNTLDNGGFPFVLDDLRFMDDAVRDAIQKLIIGLNGGALNCIVQGMDVTPGMGTNEDIAAGYLMYNGELLRVDAHSAGTVDIADYQKLIIEETFDAAGTKTFEDGGVHETYVLRRAKLEAGFNPAPPGTVIVRNGGGYVFPRLQASILGEVIELLKSWGTIQGVSLAGLTSGVTWGGGSGSLRFKKVGKVGFINFKGSFEFASTMNFFEFNVPAGWALTGSTNRQICLGTHLADGTATVVRVNVTTTGKVQIVKLSGNFTDGEIEFNSGAIPLN